MFMCVTRIPRRCIICPSWCGTVHGASIQVVHVFSRRSVATDLVAKYCGFIFMISQFNRSTLINIFFLHLFYPQYSVLSVLCAKLCCDAILFNCYLSCSFCPLRSQFHSFIFRFAVRCFSHVLIIFCICCRSIKCIVCFGARGFGVTKVVKFILQLFFPSLLLFILSISASPFCTSAFILFLQ